MGLREIAEADLALTLEDSVNGFGYSIQLIDPADKSEPLTGQSGDISELIDPDTGQAVSGRSAHVSLRISSITAAGFTSLPQQISSESSKPWRVIFNDINGNSFSFTVEDANPDRTLGVINLRLEILAVAP